MKTKLLSLVASATLLASANASAAEIDVKITNLTQGIYFTPLLVTAHTPDASLYSLGQAASPELQAMAEGGALTGLVDILNSVSADTQTNPASGLLAPTKSTMTMLSTADGNTQLSIVSMMLPTNDAFIGLNGWTIPTEPGTYSVYLNAYDAGTEANNETLLLMVLGAPGVPGIPAAPGVAPGMNGTGVTSEEQNAYIHVHRGSLGDDQADGGASDLHNTVHRWLNPVAKVTVTVK